MTARISATLRHPWVRIAGSLLILGILLAFLPVHKLAAALRSIPLTLWLWVLAGFLATHVIGVVKWRLTLHISNAQLTFAQAVRCYFAGLFGTVFLPSVVGGDVVRMGLAFRIQRNRAGVLLGSLVDRLLDTISLAVVAGVGVLLLPGALNERHRRAFIMLAIVFALTFAGLLVLLRITPWQRLPFKMRRLFVKVRRAWRSMASQPQYVLVSLLLGIIIQTGLLFLSAAIAGACGLHVSFPRLAAGVAAGEAAGFGSSDAGRPGHSRGRISGPAGPVRCSGYSFGRNRTGVGIDHHLRRPDRGIDLVPDWRGQLCPRCSES